jgi:hypothetical protein
MSQRGRGKGGGGLGQLGRILKRKEKWKINLEIDFWINQGFRKLYKVI